MALDCVGGSGSSPVCAVGLVTGKTSVQFVNQHVVPKGCALGRWGR